MEKHNVTIHINGTISVDANSREEAFARVMATIQNMAKGETSNDAIAKEIVTSIQKKLANGEIYAISE